MNRLTRAGLRRWLESMSPDTAVGTAQAAGTCPLATYLRADGDARTVVIDPKRRLVAGRYRPLPGWAVAFVRGVDMRGHRRHAVVTAGEALAVLAAIVREEAEMAEAMGAGPTAEEAIAGPGEGHDIEEATDTRRARAAGAATNEDDEEMD